VELATPTAWVPQSKPFWLRVCPTDFSASA